MEGVWRGSHVDCATSWYWPTYKGEFATLKRIVLPTLLPWLFTQMSKPPRAALRQLGGWDRQGRRSWLWGHKWPQRLSSVLLR